MVVKTNANEQCKGCVVEKKCIRCLALENSLQHQKDDENLDLAVAPSAPPVTTERGEGDNSDSDLESESDCRCKGGQRADLFTTPVSHRTRKRGGRERKVDSGA